MNDLEKIKQQISDLEKKTVKDLDNLIVKLNNLKLKFTPKFNLGFGLGFLAGVIVSFILSIIIIIWIKYN